jgi:hypothetical protein
MDPKNKSAGKQPTGTPVRRRTREQNETLKKREEDAAKLADRGGDRDRQRSRPTKSGDRGGARTSDRGGDRDRQRSRPAKTGDRSGERDRQRSRPTRTGDRGGDRDRQRSRPEKVFRKPPSRPPVDQTSEDSILLTAASARVGPGGYMSFADIPAHKLGRQLRGELYKVAKSLPDDESANLVARIKAAATTSTAALVSGFGQGTFRSGIRGALESRGALFVLQDHLDQAADFGWIDEDPRNGLREQVDAVIAAVNDYLGGLVRDRDRFLVPKS